MNKTLSRGLMACLSLVALASCQDYDGGFSLDTIKKAEYAKHFEDTFGKIDPNQDWSMATLVKANVNLPSLTGTAKMNICTGDPRNSETRLLAQIMLKDGKGSIDFDAIKGSENVFVTVEQDGEYKVFSQYALQNGMLNIGDITPEMLFASAPMTRAFTESCPTTQSTTGNYLVDAEWAKYKVPDHTEITYTTTSGTAQHTNEDWVNLIKTTRDEQNDLTQYPYTDESVRHFVKIEGIDWVNTNLTLKGEAVTSSKDLITFNGTSKTASEWQGVVDGQFGSMIMGWWPYENQSPWEESGLVPMEGYESDNSKKKFDWSKSTLTLKTSAVQGVVDIITYNNQTKTVDEWKADANNSLQPIFSWNNWNGPWPNSCFVPSGEDCDPSYTGLKKYVGLYDESHWVLKSTGVETVTIDRDEHVQVQYLSGVQTSTAPVWDAMLGNSFFGEGSFFEEGIAYYSDASRINDPLAPNNLKKQKLDKFYDEAQMVEMEKGFKIHTNAQTDVIELPYIFGCTAYSNQFGYVYWSDAEAADPNFNPLALKHFVLIEDARPGSNIKDGDGNAITGSTFQSGCWPSLVSMNPSYTGTSYRVMYFGADRNAITGDYHFPENYNIVFFISSLAGNDDETALFTTHNPHGSGTSFNYSDPELNKKLIGHETTERTGAKNGMVKCISWSHDGNTYMGFGDNSGDQDLNDIVFLVSGNFDHNEIVKVAPIKWHMNIDGKHHDGIVDGTTKDDDLFDIYSLNINATYSQPASNPTLSGFVFQGWATTPNGTPSMTIDGTVEDEKGTCYFAIWAPEGTNNITIKWHKNYNGLHHDGNNGTTADDDLHAQNIIAQGGVYSKPTTTPEAPAGKRFKGWAENADDTDVLDDEELTDVTGTEDKCYFAIWEDIPTPPGTDPTWISWTVACEDLGGTFDYDFNDLVFALRLKKVAGSNSTLELIPLAAGGTLEAHILYDGNDVGEIHTLLGGGTNYSKIINATAGETPSAGTPVTLSTSIASTASINDIKSQISIYVKKNDATTDGYTVENLDGNGEISPQMLLLPDGWKWPSEGIKISTVYESFSTWVANSYEANWAPKQGASIINNPMNTEGIVVDRPNN